MSVQATVWAFRQQVAPSARKFVLVALANYADAEGFCWPSQKVIAEITCMTVRAVRRHLSALEDGGLIARAHRRRANGSQTSDEFLLDLQAESGRESPNSQADRMSAPPGQNVRQCGSESGGNRTGGQSYRRTECPPPPDTESAPTTFEPSYELVESTPPTPPPETAVADPVAAMVARWNALAAETGLVAVQKITDARRARGAARLVDVGGLDGWEKVLGRVRGSGFLLGRNGTGWKATFDFVVRESSFVKLMEGNFDDKNSGGDPNRPSAAELDDRLVAAALAAPEYEQ